MYCRPSATMRPHSAVPGWAPKPMKLSAAVVRMMAPRSSVAWTTTGLRAFGRMWRTITRTPRAPIDRAASMYSRSRILSVWAVTIRAYGAHHRSEIAITIAHNVRCCTAATTAMARSRPGNARKTSVIRSSSSPQAPPPYPAASPTAVPTDVEIASTIRPLPMAGRAPYNTRLKTSNPELSVPNQWRGPGGWNRSSSEPATGPYGARTGAKIATRNSPAITAPPNSTRGLRNGFASSTKADPRIHVGIRQVREQVGEGKDHGGERRVGRDRGKIERCHGADRVPADPGPVEDELRDDRSGQQPARGEPEHRDRRQHRITERVSPGDPPLGHAFGAGGAHVILVQHLEHGSPRHPAHQGDERQREAHRR